MRFVFVITGILFYANSICFMTCICLDRYMATVHPHAYLKLRGPKYALLPSSVLWAVAGIAAAVFILMGPLETQRDNSGGHSCFENFAPNEWSSRLFPYSLLIISCSLLPSTTILVFYSLAARRISRIHTKMGRRALRVIYVTLAITLICFLPNHAVYLLHLLRCMKVIQSCPLANAIYNARRVTMAIVILNTCLDPLLYYVTTSHCTWKPLKRSWFGVRRRRVIYTITE
ncbi:uracil nucleotide/cysteinyl leukotriene receptor [Stigmatopora nigra]